MLGIAKRMTVFRAIGTLGSLLAFPIYQACADSAPPTQPSVLIYTLTTASEISSGPVPTFGLLGGAFIDLIGAGYAKSHEKFLTALRSMANDGLQQVSLLHPLACAAIAAPDSSCRRIVEAKEGVAKNKLVPLLQAEPTRSARIAEMKRIRRPFVPGTY